MPLSTACDFNAAMPRARALGECDDDGWCREDPLSTAAKTRLASQSGAEQLWLWSERALHQLLNGKWVAHTVPPILGVTGAVVLAANDIWITTNTLGEAKYLSYLHHYDGANWKRVVKVAEALSDLRASPDGTLWARARTVGVGYESVERFDGKAWQVMDERPAPAGDSSVLDFRPISADEAWVMRGTSVEHISGGSWQRIEAPTRTTLTALDVLPDGSVWLAGFQTDKALLFQIASERFSPRALPDFPRISALGGTSAEDLWLATGARVDHFDGQKLDSTHEWFGSFVHELVAMDSSNLFVLTTNPNTGINGQIINWNGSRWDDTDPLMPSLATVWGSANDDIWASGTSGRFHFDGQTWSKDAAAGDYALWGTASDNVYALGGAGVIQHYDGQRWTQVVDSDAYGKRGPLHDHDSLSGDAASSLWVAAGGVWHYDGTRLSRVSEDVGAVSVHAFTATDVWVATGRDLLHYDGAEWQALGVAAWHVWGTSSQDLWVVEDPADSTAGYFMSHFDGSTWTRHRPRTNTFNPGYPVQYGANKSQLGGCGNYLWVSQGNRVNLFDGTEWSTILRGGPFDGALWGKSPNALLVVGDRSGVTRRAP